MRTPPRSSCSVARIIGIPSKCLIGGRRFLIDSRAVLFLVTLRERDAGDADSLNRS
jgi:hypothetical protein